MEKASYESHLRNQNDHWWFNARQKIIEAFFTPYEDEVLRGAILDIGSGGGRVLGYLSRLGNVKALDKEPMVVEYIKKNFGADIGKIGCLPNAIDFPDKFFRLITAFDVLEHVKEDEESLVTIRKLLEPGGLCLLTVPAYNCFWSYHDDLSHHIRRYSSVELANKMKAAGLKVERMTFFNTLLLLPIIVLRHLRKKTLVSSRNIRNDMDIAPGRSGRLLELIFSIEKYWIRYAKFPIGLSIAVIGRKT